MVAVCMIPARGGSRGIPRKNLQLVGGRPLVDWSILCALQSQIYSKVIVTSDDPETLERARLHGAMPIQRPAEIAGDTATSESALLHAYSHCGLNRVDEITFLQPTSPLRDPQDLIRAVEHFRKSGFDSLFSSVVIQDRFIWEERQNGFESVNYDWRNRMRRQELTIKYLENGSFYIFKPSVLLETGNRLGGKIGTFVMENWKAPQVDTPEDLELVDILIRSKKPLL